ncbi:MAG: 2,3-bisphosphoglycerate-independent phosphoglycerate mutase [Candidatus Nanohaloarchaea archaeon]|nr:2,3-bisphosphoglycerate-independent phosphoglycerate mutase [Candidatus Nanohaloarchaea archaeon]
MTKWQKPVLLVVMDGFGIREEDQGNAIAQADTSCIDRLLQEYPSTEIPADGKHVGLPDNGLGGSEVGHMQIGAGRNVAMTPKRISNSIESGEFIEKDALVEAVEQAKENGGTLHVMGLCSDKSIHSNIEHLYPALKLAKMRGLEQVCIHAFLDGRDTEPKEAKKYISQLQNRLKDLPGEICTVSGRYYSMDRDGRWERTEKAYRAIVHGEGRAADGALEAVESAYERGETDEFVEPTVIENCGVDEGDSVFFFNFRADRARQITRAFVQNGFDKFPTKDFQNLYFVSMRRYSDEFENPVLFRKQILEDTLGQVLADRGLKQFRIAESEKRAHVTYFFSGRREKPFNGEERKIFQSPKVDVYSKTPEMRAEAIKEKALEVMKHGEHDFILVNFSNCDMVGHTGDLEATIDAVEEVDSCIEELFEFCKNSKYVLMVTADHGNAEEMVDKEGNILTAHTYNKVPFILAEEINVNFNDDPELSKIAPAVMSLNDEKIPEKFGGGLFELSY